MENIMPVFHRSETILYLDPKIWVIILFELKELTNVLAFKKDIKEWKPKTCPCRLCKKYVSNLGFITLTSSAFLKLVVLKIYCI